MRVAINGVGRIGRALLKQIIDHGELELVAVNDLVDPENLAYLLRYDSVYGRYPHTVQVENGGLAIGNHGIQVFREREPERLPWRDLDVDVVFECTGVFRRAEDMQRHVAAGAKHVILSAPVRSGNTPGVKLYVVGVTPIEGFPELASCASCTTNCITPVMEVLDRRLGVDKALMTTVHAYTSSQALVDGPSKKVRRGRAAALNLVPSTTGAANATVECLPQLEERFGGVAIRAPVACGSIADIVCVARRETSVDELKQIFRDEASSERYDGILGVAEDPIVSSDVIGDTRASVVDLSQIAVVGGTLIQVMSWYDNEWGYAAQMIRFATRAAREVAAVG